MKPRGSIPPNGVDLVDVKIVESLDPIGGENHSHPIFDDATCISRRSSGMKVIH